MREHRLIVFLVHEHVKFAVEIGIRHLLGLHLNGFELRGRVEGLVGKNLSRHDVFKRRSDERRALAGLYVLEIGNGINAALELERYALSDIAC